MNLKLQKELARKVLKVGKDRVWIDPDHLEEIKEAITRADIKCSQKLFGYQSEYSNQRR